MKKSTITIILLILTAVILLSGGVYTINKMLLEEEQPLEKQISGDYNCDYNKKYREKDLCTCRGNWVESSGSFYCELAELPLIQIFEGRSSYDFHHNKSLYQISFKTNKWLLVNNDSNAMDCLISKNDKNCKIWLGVGGHGMPFDLSVEETDIKLNNFDAHKQVWLDENQEKVLIVITFRKDNTDYMFEITPSSEQCIDESMKIMETFQYLD